MSGADEPLAPALWLRTRDDDFATFVSDRDRALDLAVADGWERPATFPRSRRPGETVAQPFTAVPRDAAHALAGAIRRALATDPSARLAPATWDARDAQNWPAFLEALADYLERADGLVVDQEWKYNPRVDSL